MRIAGSATYLLERARRRTTRGAALILSGMLAVPAGFIASQQVGATANVGGAALFLGLAGFLVGTLQMLAGVYDRRASGGEAPVVTQLRARLGDDFTYLRHVSIPPHGVPADGILVGPGGVLVLAIRALAGEYVVRGHDWYFLEADGTERPLGRSPTWEVTRPLRALQRSLQEGGLPPVPVHGAVVLVHGTLRSAELPGSAIVPVDRIATYVDYLQQGQAVAPEVLESVVAYLEPHIEGRTTRPRAT
ncbi:MAG TPA: nuclease-related domain-containing protein [Chloroflexota bacterium]|nr:nuclease-related domain-containing protein [Chloroflexota bacterium]